MGGDADLLVCGSCRQDFLLDNLSAFVAHKKFDCDINDPNFPTLLCQLCPEAFMSPWQLLQHAQGIHAMKLFQDNRQIKQPDKTATFTASQSYVQSAFEDGGDGAVMECSLLKSLTFVPEHQKSGNETAVKAESDNRTSGPLRERNASESSQTSKSDVGTQVEDLTAEEKRIEEDDGNFCCCSNQNCGVTVMPGTHERLKECCNAVVPKKRKRHMETKHIPMTLLRKKKLFEGTKVRRSERGDIYIDVETSGLSDLNTDDKHSSGTSDDKSSKSPSPVRDAPQCMVPGLKQKSVIIQPGTTFSIPVSYAVVQQPFIHGKNRTGNVSDKPSTVTRANISSAAVNDRPVVIVDSSRITPMKSSDKNVNNAVKQLTFPTSLPLSVQSNKPVTSTSVICDTNPSGQPVPLTGDKLFDSQPQNLVAGSCASDATKSSSSFDQKKKKILSLVMSMNKDMTSTDQESNFQSVVIDSQETGATAKITQLPSNGQESQVLVDIQHGEATISEGAASQESPVKSEDKSELLIADSDNSQGSDSKSMKKRRYPTSRPFKCDQCSQAFNQRIHLRKHQSKHTGIKPFKCYQCDYSTVERSHLKVHIRVHTGEKPYKCTYCEYATAQNSTLKIHLKRHHDGEGSSGLSCRTCGKKFKEQENLEVHYRQHDSTEEH